MASKKKVKVRSPVRKKTKSKKAQEIPSINFRRENKESSDNVKLWLDRIENVLAWLSKDHWNGWKSWKAAYLLDRTVHWMAQKDGENLDHRTEFTNTHRVTVPLLSNIIRNTVPFLLNRAPFFFGHSANPEKNRAVQIRIAHLNTVWREQKMTWQVMRSIFDAAIIGHGICKVGFTRNLNSLTLKPEESGKLTYQDYIKDETAWIRRINPFHFIFDRTGVDYDLDTARWCAELIPDSVQNILDNNNYRDEAKKALLEGRLSPVVVQKQSAGQTNEDFNNLWAPFSDEHRDHVEIDEDTQIIKAEVWDKKFGKRMVLLLGSCNKPSDQLLFDAAWPEVLDNNTFPYRKMDFIYLPNQSYGMGQVRYGVDTQKLINLHRTMLAEVLSRMPAMLTHTGEEELTEENKRLIKNNEVGSVVELKVGASLDRLKGPELTESFDRSTSILQSDLGELSDQDILFRGGNLPSRTTASEIEARQRIQNAKLDQQQDAAHTFILDLARLVLKYNASLKADQLVPVLGKKGRIAIRITSNPNAESEFEAPLTVLQEEIARLELNVVSKDIDPPAIKRRQLMELFQLVMNPNALQLFQALQIPINVRGLFRSILETFNIPEFEESFGILSEEPPIIPSTFTPVNAGSQPGISGDNEGNGESSVVGGVNNPAASSLVQDFLRGRNG